MPKTIKSKISDPRPRINVTIQSDDEKTEAIVSKGYVNVQRGTKTAILRVPFGEVQGVIDLLTEAGSVLTENQYDISEGSNLPAGVVLDPTTNEPTPADSASNGVSDETVQTAATEGQGAPEEYTEDADQPQTNDNEQFVSQDNPFANA